MIDTETRLPSTEPSRPSRLPRAVGAAAGLLLLASGFVVWMGQSSEPAPPERAAHAAIAAGGKNQSPQVPLPVDLPAIETAETGNAAADDQGPAGFAAAILGTWKQYSSGHRLLQVNGDGTATIDVKLDGFAAIAFGEKLHFDIEWEIDDDQLVFRTTGGTPEASVNAVQAVYGDRRVYRILEMNAKQMLLREGDEEKTPWDRVVKTTP